MNTEYDALVIGSGTAGQTAAYDLNRQGLNVGLVEHSDRPGGTCALRGCQAKKWFYEGAEVVARSRHLQGIGITTPAVADWQALREEKNRFTNTVPDNTVTGLEKAGIAYIKGHARFTGAHSITVDGKLSLSANYIVVATGAAPAPLPIEGSQWLTTSDEFMQLETLPRRLCFIGAGFISFELAHFAARLGPKGIDCTILESGSRPLGAFDDDMVELLVEASEQEGIKVLCEVEITEIKKSEDGFHVRAGNGKAFECDIVVHGAGRAPNIDDLDLEQAGIESSPKGISVNSEMATTNADVYAVGDCAATVQLARVADAEAGVAAGNIIKRHRDSQHRENMDYTHLPAVLFTYPQYAMVGVTEQSLKDKGRDYEIAFGKELSWPTYRRVGLKSAAYKVLTDKNGKILGAHVIADNATGLINIFTLAMANHIHVETLYNQSIMTPYPSRESDILYMLKPLIV